MTWETTTQTSDISAIPTHQVLSSCLSERVCEEWEVITAFCQEYYLHKRREFLMQITQLILNFHDSSDKIHESVYTFTHVCTLDNKVHLHNAAVRTMKYDFPNTMYSPYYVSPVPRWRKMACATWEQSHLPVLQHPPKGKKHINKWETVIHTCTRQVTHTCIQQNTVHVSGFCLGG